MANNKMLIDAAHPEETRVAIVRGNRVEEFDFESEHKTQIRGNIYLAKVTRVEPSLQAAFVDYGGNRHGFLAFSEIHPDYYQIPVADRQALLAAEAEDERKSAAQEDADDDMNADDGDDDGENVEPAEEEVKTKPARSRRSRRGGGKSAKSKSDDVVENDTKEENDDNDEEISADNDGDDVVSEPAKKPRTRRTSRKKKPDDATPDEAQSVAKSEQKSETAMSESTDGSEAPKEEKPKPRRRTSRKKAEPIADDSVKAEVEADQSTDEKIGEAKPKAEQEEKPKRRRTSRKAKKESKPESEDDVVVADSEQSAAVSKPADEDTDDSSSEAKPKSRSRSRRRSKKQSNGNGNSDNSSNGDNENDEPNVESVGSEDALEEVPARRVNRRHYKIQEVIKRRQILLVQVVKEERGNKGAALTTYLSLAGRYSVLMPNTARGGGISRKITNASDRKRLKTIANGLDVPQGMGVILRTAGASRQPEDIQRDFEYLMRLWENVRTLTLQSTAPCLVYEEGSLIKRSIRDLYDNDTGEVLVAGDAGFREARDFMTMLMPHHANRVKQYRDRIPLFARMGVEAQLDAMLQPQVTLKSGGYIIIDQTEALVAIDVNSGRSTRQHSIEETAHQTNLEAADEVARQLRLRDLAGLIVIDFIDMDDRRNVRAVEKRLKDALKNDRARIQVGRISHFGLMEMSRQRIRASVLESTTQVCPICEGLGHVRSSSSIALAVLRAIEEQLNKNSRNHLNVKVSPQTALYLLNSKRENLSDLEIRFGVSLSIETDPTLGNVPCTIERGELSDRAPAPGTAIQPEAGYGDEVEVPTAPEAAAEDEPTQPIQSAKSGDGRNDENDDEDGDGKKRRRRRRRRRGSNQDDEGNSETLANANSEEPSESTTEAVEPTAENDEKPTQRSRRSRRSPVKKSTADADVTATEKSVEEVSAPQENGSDPAEPDDKPKAKTTRARRPRKTKEPQTEAVADVQSEPVSATTEDDASGPQKRRTTRRKTGSDDNGVGSEPDPVTEEKVADADVAVATEKPKKGKSGWWNRKFF